MFEFISDRPVLDFVATVSERHSSREEKLPTPADLQAWIAESGLVDERVEVDDEQLDHAREVRESAFAVIAAAIDDRPAPAADRARVNETAAGPRPVLRLEADGRLRRRGDLPAVLAELASDCLDLVGGPDRSALHWCADATCTRPFVDRSRGQRRRWCGMKGCGDRAKAAAYRQRRSNRTSPASA
ncbi:CGNR zinc finger domain-containing protein [uncultured Friedmanniella sp.]|uniref:CGNR zinc finger domain-containing protein n=1 Tax=uncultured Friedmanniella sp. TaxID=335381 RepID=UPI0035CAD07D